MSLRRSSEPRLVAVALAAYWLPGSVRYYNHFVWQALAFLDGRAAITWPVPGNDFFQDVLPLRDAAGNLTGFGLLPFPPLPAIVLMPFVGAVGPGHGRARGLRRSSARSTSGCAGGRSAACRSGARSGSAVTIFFGFGTVAWYAAGLGTTWFFAHVVALAPLLAAVGVALGGDRSFAADAAPGADAGGDDEIAVVPGPSVGQAVRGAARARPRPGFEPRWPSSTAASSSAGLLFGLACTARLTVVFGAPFFMLVGSGGSLARRSVSAGLGAAIPVGLLLAYNVVSTGHLFHPGYEYLYQLEANGYRALGYNPDWAIEDLRYLPQNLGIMFLSTPALFPDNIPSGLGARARPVRGGGRAARPVRPGLPDRPAARRRDEPPPDQPGLPATSFRRSAASGARGSSPARPSPWRRSRSST